MTNYVKSTNFATKDNLASGDPLKIVKGTEINTEFDNIAVAVATKADVASPTFTGTTTIATLALTNDLAVTDGGTGASTATDARTNLSAAKSGANSDITSITGLTTALTVAQGGTGAATLTANNVVLGNGTSAVQFVAPSTAGNVLVSNGTTWTSGTGTSVNGQTGTIVTTTLDNIGSMAVVAVFSSSNFLPGATIAGSSLYYANTISSVEDVGIVSSNGSYPGIGTYWKNASSLLGCCIKKNSGNTGATAPSGASTLTGTYRIMSVVRGYLVSYDGGEDQTSTTMYCTLVVRVS